MTSYRYAGIAIASTLPLDELLPAADPGEPVVIDIVVEAEAVVPADTSDAGSLLTIRTDDAGYLLAFPDLAAFRLADDGGRIAIVPGPGCNGETLAHLLLDQVLPRALGHRGWVVLHGGAVAVDGGAIAFIGPSGAGKSTLAASFLDANHGLLSDDGLVLSLADAGVIVRPTYRSLRLWPSSLEEVFEEPPRAAAVAHYSTKQRVRFETPPGPAQDEPRRLLALFILAEQYDGQDRSLSMARLGPADTLMAMMQNAFRLDVADRGRLARLFEAAGDMAATLPAYTIAYPHDFAVLPAVRDAILETLSHPGPST